MFEILKQWDTELFLFLNGLNSSFWDTVMWWVSGKLTWLPLYLLIIGFVIYKFRLKSILIVFSIIVLITLSDQLSVHLFKNLFHRLRPCHNAEIAGLVHLVNNYCGGQYGFISSHASNTFALASFLSFLFKQKYVSLFIFIWAALVSYSRVYLGVHYPFDVFAGALFGFGLGWMIWMIMIKFMKLPIRHRIN